MPDPESLEEKHRQLASEVVDLFLPDDKGLSDEEVEELELANEPKILALLAKLDPVEAAAVAVQVCFELDPEEISDFLAILEGEEDSDAESGDGG